MATVAGVPIEFDRTGFEAGAAFRLVGSRLEPAAITTSDGQLVELHPEAGVAVVYLPESIETLIPEAHAAAQRVLDLVAFTEGGIGTLPLAQDESLWWWREGSEIRLRLLVTKEVRVTVGPVTVEVTDSQGNIRPPEPQPEPEWTPALRFYRQSQVAKDVYEAYRNAFLALEAILSRLVSGGPTKEREWLEHALREVECRGLVSMSRYVAAGVDDPVTAFLADQYVAFRCATFHAKEHRGSVLLPGSLLERDKVEEALEPLTRLVIDLTGEVVKVRPRTGGLTLGGFEGLVIAPMVDSLKLELTGEAASGDEMTIALSRTYIGRFDDQGYEYCFVGEAQVVELAGRAFHTLTAVAPEPGGLAMGTNDRLSILKVDPAGADRLEIFLAYALANQRMPKRRFSF